ncbi:MAG TPA: hypothetical protein VEQ58_05175, partial [Polyangiaceae bacterium]|nr:hypothetical protein [Polyangiaceae bacterium]
SGVASSEAETEELELAADLRSALKGGAVEPAPPDVLAGFQKKLRQRSGGKFYEDGWSTSRHPPINTYLITSLMMLAVIGIIYALLAPLSGEPVPVENTPQPVQIISPKP